MAADAAHGRHARAIEEWERTAPVIAALLRDRVLRAVWFLLGVAAALCLAGMLTACTAASNTPGETGDFLTAKPARHLCLENSRRFRYDARECDGDEAAPLGDCLTAACADIILRRPPSYDPNQTRS